MNKSFKLDAWEHYHLLVHEEPFLGLRGYRRLKSTEFYRVRYGDPTRTDSRSRNWERFKSFLRSEGLEPPHDYGQHVTTDGIIVDIVRMKKFLERTYKNV